MKKNIAKILPAICVLLTFIAVGILLWTNSKVSIPAQKSIYPKIVFQGEYKIGDEQWQEYRPGLHLSANAEGITFKGTLHMLLPSIEQDLGTVSQGDIIAFYCDHLKVSIREEGSEPVFLETEIPKYENTCAKLWQPYRVVGAAGQKIEIWVQSPHTFGNENAVDEMLNNIYLYAGHDFEEDRIREGSLQRAMGMMILLCACCMLGVFLFAGRIHIRGNNLIGLVAFLMIVAGGYIILSSPNVNLWKTTYFFNTTVLGICMMLYQYLVTVLVTYVLGTKTQKAAKILVHISGGIPAVLLLFSLKGNIHFYGTWGIWAVLESLVSLTLIFCVWYDLKNMNYPVRTFQIAATAPLLSFVLDVCATAAGWWQGGKSSMVVFYVQFLAIVIIVMRVIPEKINEAARAKELEEKQRELQQELKDRRVSVMMSQIKTHFIFNVMTIISGLCNSDPSKADDALILFARYLRKNIAIMDHDEPVLFTQELQHLEDYISLEKLRFREKIKFEKNLEITDFKIPPLTIQPLVENAIKHGFLTHGKQGTVRLSSKVERDYVRVVIEDDGVGCVPEDLEKEEAVGIKNVRYRVENMVGGTLAITSAPEKGTKAVICIPQKNVGK